MVPVARGLGSVEGCRGVASRGVEGCVEGVSRPGLKPMGEMSFALIFRLSVCFIICIRGWRAVLFRGILVQIMFFVCILSVML